MSARCLKQQIGLYTLRIPRTDPSPNYPQSLRSEKKIAMETPHQVGKRWLKRTFVLVAMMFGIKGVFALAGPNPVNHLAQAVVLLLTMPVVFGLPAYCLGYAATSLRRWTQGRGRSVRRPSGMRDELVATQHGPPSVPAPLVGTSFIESVRPQSRSARRRHWVVLGLPAVAIIAALAVFAGLAMTDRALLIWIDSAGEAKAREDKERLRAAFDRLDAATQAAERAQAADVCNLKFRSDIYLRDIFCVASDELVLEAWAAKKGVPQLEVEPCVYVYGTQTFRRPRAGGDLLCTTLIKVERE